MTRDDYIINNIAKDYGGNIIAKRNLSLFTGFRLGYNHCTMKSTFTDIYPNYTKNLDVTMEKYAIQAHLGFSYFIKGIVGFNSEVGLSYGGPYYAALGICVKI